MDLERQAGTGTIYCLLGIYCLTDDNTFKY